MIISNNIEMKNATYQKGYFHNLLVRASSLKVL